MAVLASKNPNELRGSAGRKIDRAKALRDELDSGEFRGDATLTESRIDELTTEAKAERNAADDIERAEVEAAGGTWTGQPSLRKPPRQDIGSPWEIGEPQAARPDRRGYKDAQGHDVAVLASNESLTQWRQTTGAIPASSFGEPLPRVGEVIRDYLVGGERPEFKAEQSGGSHTAGGYMLSPAISSQIVDLARSASVVVRAGARTVDMPTSELVMVKVDTEPTVSWTAENTALSKTSAVFGRLTFRARKMTAIVPLSIELVRDATNAVEEIERLLAIAAAQELDRAALLGDADGEEPTGLFNYPGVTENAIGGAVDWDDYLDSIAAIETANGMPNALIYPPAVKKALAQLKVNSEANHYAPPPSDIDDLMRLTTTKLASSQSIVGDFTQVMIGVRSGIELIASQQVQLSDGSGYEKDQLLVKLRWRGDVQFAHPDHFEKLTGIS